jgi:signal transduction histidine kinase
MALRFPRSLSARITIAFMVLVVTFGGISLSTVLTLHKLHKAMRITHSGYLNLALGSSDLNNSQNTLRQYLREELGEETQERWARKRLERLLRKREELFASLEATLEEVGSADQFVGTAELVAGIRKLVDKTRPHYKVLLKAPPISRNPDAPAASPDEQTLRDAARKAQRQLLTLELEIGRESARLKAHEARLVVTLSRDLEEVFKKTWLFTLVWGASAVVLGIFMAIGATLMLRPLRRLRDAASRIARGEYADRISTSGPPEISNLATEFNAMAQAIEEREARLVRQTRLATAGQLAAQITHEIRNPLSSIGLNTSMIEEELEQLPAERSEEALSLCRSINREVDQLTALTEEYLQFARLPEAKFHPESLEHVVSSTCDFMREELKGMGVELEVETGEPVLLPMDEGQIRRVVMNLIRNAAEATADAGGGSVRVKVSHDGRARLEVADSGQGIPEDVLPSIFEPFVTRKEGGTGLGLAVSQQIVAEHGGEIRAANRPDGGAEFTVELPLLRPRV